MQKITQTRREFLSHGSRGMALFVAAGLSLSGRALRAAEPGPFYSLEHLGPLMPPDANGVMLPAGFRSRIVARSGQPAVAGGHYAWHPAPDGGACFATEDGGWIYVSNSEVRTDGGVGALRFDRQGKLVDSYPILQGSSVNCAGGMTPWNTWLSCEEHEQGQVYECDPTGKKPAQLRPALGTFKHEAVAVDPLAQHLYLTEDLPDGGFYRFTPANPLPDISAGTLEIAHVQQRDGRSWVSWYPVKDPLARSQPTRKQFAGYTPFNGGEGIGWHAGRVYFSTKGDNRVWWFDCDSSELGLLYDYAEAANPELSGVDNLLISSSGDVLVAEDKGNMQIVVLTPGGRVVPVVQIVGQDSSEITGPAFDPYYQRLYFSSQRGSGGMNSDGVTYEITGPV